jgi:hypothetical protein
MTSGHDVSEYVGTLGLVKSYFFKFFENKMKKKSRKKKYLGAPTPPEDEEICLFAGLLANPDIVLSLEYQDGSPLSSRGLNLTGTPHRGLG